MTTITGPFFQPCEGNGFNTSNIDSRFGDTGYSRVKSQESRLGLSLTGKMPRCLPVGSVDELRIVIMVLIRGTSFHIAVISERDWLSRTSASGNTIDTERVLEPGMFQILCLAALPMTRWTTNP